jgi:hypothetical protein
MSKEAFFNELGQKGQFEYFIFVHLRQAQIWSGYATFIILGIKNKSITISFHKITANKAIYHWLRRLRSMTWITQPQMD